MGIKLGIICVFMCFLINCVNCVSPKDQNQEAAQNRLTEQIFAIIEHYKQEDPVGLPGATVPDPMSVPDVKKSFSVATMHMKNIKAYGLSKFRIKYIKTDLKELQVKSGIQVDLMTTLGNYSLNSFLTRSEGPFSVIIKNVYVQGNASLAVEMNGKLKTQDIQMDISFDDMAMDFQNLGVMGTVFQGFVNSAPNVVFDTMKPFILSEAYTKIRVEIDKNLDKALQNQSFPNSISPLDMAIAEARKQVRNMGYDPFKVKDYNHTVGVFSVQMSNTWITGVSSFYRVGNVTISVENNTVIMGMQVGTQKILGSTQWEVTLGSGMITRSGQAQFSIQHMKVSMEISQSLDTRKRSQMKDLQLELGNIQVRCDGAGTLDYVIELIINILPNLIRYQIMDAIENPVKMRIQEILNQINVEEVIKQKVPEFLKYGVSGVDMNFDIKF